jgi:hypothetical protein
VVCHAEEEEEQQQQQEGEELFNINLLQAQIRCC